MELLKIYSNQKILKFFALIFIGTIALTFSAKLRIPFYPIPMTMQTFIVLFLGIAFGYKIGLATVGAYLFEGIIGIPVFSISFTNSNITAGANSEDLITTVLPIANAGANFVAVKSI